MQTLQRANLEPEGRAGEFLANQLVVHLQMKRVTQIVVSDVAESMLNRSEGSIAIMSGAKVVTSDGQTIGTVERVLAHPEVNGPAHYWIACGLLLNQNRRVPIEWIESFGHDEVRLAVGARAAEAIGRAKK